MSSDPIPATVVAEEKKAAKKQCHPNSKQVLADWRDTCKQVKGKQCVIKSSDPDYQKAKDLFHAKHPEKVKPEKAI